MSRVWHIGCSGFHYKHWKGTFYPEKLPQTKWFSYYCEHFSTLELNVTFYRFPRLPALQNWYEKSPAAFVFAVKAPRAITHYKKFSGTERMLSDFYGLIRDGLQEKLGCVLFQLSPRTRYTPERLQKIVESLDPAFDNVLEFRHASWWNSDVYSMLSKHHIAFCGMSHPDFPSDIVQNTDLLYYRFHGVPELYRSAYKQPQLKKFADTVTAGKTKKAFVYFNNDAAVAAIDNAKQLQAYVNKPTAKRKAKNRQAG
jgi:uncharacterized protein YecE (DUF72 family)